jgi:transcriptional regulator with XRE-family HTH domain
MRNKQQISDYLLNLMKQKGVSKKQLGAFLGAIGKTQLKVQKASQFLNINNPKIDINKLFEVAVFLEVLPEDILFESKDLNKKINSITNITINEAQFVPVLSDQKIIAGERSTGDLNDWLIYPYVSNAQKIIAYAVRENEPIKGVAQHDFVFVDQRINGSDLEALIVLIHNDESVMLRRYVQTKTGYMLVSDNKRNPLIIVEHGIETDVFIYGKVISILQKT